MQLPASMHNINAAPDSCLHRRRNRHNLRATAYMMAQFHEKNPAKYDLAWLHGKNPVVYSLHKKNPAEQDLS